MRRPSEHAPGALGPAPGGRLYEALHPDSVVVDSTGRALRPAVATLDRRLAGDELGVVTVPPGGEIALRRALRDTSLEVRARFLPRPAHGELVRLVSPDPGVLAAVLSGSGRRQAVGRTVLRAAPGLALGAHLRPTVALLQAREGRYGAWLVEVLPACDPRRLAVFASRTHEVVVQAWGSEGSAPVGWAKRGAVAAEAEALRRIAARARTAEVRVPEVLGERHGVLATSPVPGAPAAGILTAHPGHAGAILGRLAAWLGGWHARTARPRALTPVDLERHVLAPLGRLAPLLAPAYADWLGARCAAALGSVVPFAPAHQDLTMVNVLVDGRGLGIVDWETATEEAPPLIDLPYALADAVAACAGYGDRVDAFHRCFGPPAGGVAGMAQAVLAGTARASGASAAALSLGFHACWLSHAVNDLERDGPTGPFVRMAQVLAADPVGRDPFAA
jgi:hypothetical protein